MGKNYDRLTAWAKTNGRPLKVEKHSSEYTGVTWSISTGVTDPVTFNAYASDADVEKAATDVISDLENVGVKVP